MFDLKRSAANGGVRILVFGHSGSGKSTLAAELSRVLAIPFIELDAIHWNDDWVESSPDVFRDRLLSSMAAAGSSWIIAGNYLRRTPDVSWPCATHAIFLDYPLPIIFWRILKRTFWRWWTQEHLWGTNCTEQLSETFSRRGILWWCLSQHADHRRRIRASLEAYEGHIELLRFTKTVDCQRWLRQLQKGS